ncbi:hypothetical protein MTBBW1_2030082 [Desulfamplus magnetovallimortis]|uniref:Uncharacterized protein n=1 Tax=Desulfamplus magnetovallimortis TaxID=1246637 RepID=A0A1W1HC64_9BACT|nr:hypothetical protein MTBBW1_2030082 [Desulfamplus magnetovallimortis]
MFWIYNLAYRVNLGHPDSDSVYKAQKIIDADFENINTFKKIKKIHSCCQSIQLIKQKFLEFQLIIMTVPQHLLLMAKLLRQPRKSGLPGKSMMLHFLLMLPPLYWKKREFLFPNLMLWLFMISLI